MFCLIIREISHYYIREFVHCMSFFVYIIIDIVFCTSLLLIISAYYSHACLLTSPGVCVGGGGGEHGSLQLE